MKYCRLTPSNKHCFFGYYDKSPWNPQEDKLLFGEVSVCGRMPCQDEKMQVGYIDLHDKQPRYLAETTAWNFQQGCMLQWLGDNIVFNNIVGKKFVAQVSGISGDVLDQYDWPIYAVSHDGKCAMSVNFSRIREYRGGYGYLGASFEDDGTDGIRHIDLASHHSRIIVSYTQLKELLGKKTLKQYWVDHILFSPNDKKIAFLFRSLTDDGGLCSRLFCCNVDGSDLKCLLDTGMASHADWFDNKTFAIWARRYPTVSNIQSGYFKKLLKPVIQTVRKIGIPGFLRTSLCGDAFLMINTDTRESETFAEYIPVQEGGGHFSFSENRKWMLNDAPPDKEGVRELMLCNMVENKRYRLCDLYTPLEIHNTGYRCDLHPRWSPSNDFICFDSIHEGFRAMYQVNVSKVY